MSKLDAIEMLAPLLRGNSDKMKKVRKQIVEAATIPIDIFISGEIGTGKKVVARCLHDISLSRQESYVAVDCGMMSDSRSLLDLFGYEAGAFIGAHRQQIGKVEIAQGGTLFLDHIELMPKAMQVRISRLLKDRVFERFGSNQSIALSCRVIAASRTSVEPVIREDKFLNELFYQLNVICIDLPPLRARPEDIPRIYVELLGQAATLHNRPVPLLCPRKMFDLSTREWPGNILELRSMAERDVLGIDSNPVFSRF